MNSPRIDLPIVIEHTLSLSMSTDFVQQTDGDESEDVWMSYAVFSPFTVLQLELQGKFEIDEDFSCIPQKL